MNEEHDVASEFIPDAEDKSTGSTALTLPHQNLPDKLYLIPATNRPFFPAQVQPLVFGAKPWEETIKRVFQTEEKVLGLSFIKDFSGEVAEPEEFPEIGCAVKVHNVVEVDDQIQFIALGVQRFRIVNWLRRRPPFLVQVEYIEDQAEDEDTLKAYAMALINAIKELLPLNPLYSEELKNYLNRFSPREPSPLADFAAAITTAPGAELQEVLETISIQRRMEKVLVLIRKEQEVAKLQSQISEEVNLKINKHQREFFLKEQLKVIQKELGIAKDDKTAEMEEFQKRIKGREIPPAAKKKIDEEMNKFSMLEIGSPEFSVTRNYLDWATSVPWGVVSEDNLDLSHARKVLDEDHDGLDDVKDRIIEFLAVGAYKQEVAGSILLLVGPPGVGKTSIGQSVANALGRKFYRFSLGGMRDEAEIKGHRRTYIGALPGKLVQALKEVDVTNPVIMLDEIDKIGASFRGDPASALLEVLDPSQNSEFLDHYLDMRIDLSKVLFVCTANQLDTIPGPLLDRMDTLRLSGYITQEKVAIAKNHLWPKQLQKAGLKKNQVKISDATLKTLIEGYARESGVRHLEKLLARIIRKAVLKILDDRDLKIKIGVKDLDNYLGKPYFSKEKVLQGVGVITGLAWTAMGGATLPVEATKVHSLAPGFRLTGRLGETMKESAQISYSYIMSHLKTFGASEDFFNKSYIHLHVPEGATPKDGPSAGVTMASALLSLAKGRKPKALAMTGELTLTGHVLAVGGIREKVISARRSNIKIVILPEANRRDFEELPEYIKEGMTAHFARTFADVEKHLF
ncbi:endopeptidase La [Sansalvadorimonas verongulae]|uniref:endopeptidase La n=1 Tax=Sansalvadorimonas verongulae TaxID=2172824 RepID=UPI0012BC1963|nr:endopeptidase La [Sansalvadorimonas verongulae]MTI13885.1 endopeptidase La [Sansalvadorimonas verongulae]